MSDVKDANGVVLLEVAVDDAIWPHNKLAVVFRQSARTAKWRTARKLYAARHLRENPLADHRRDLCKLEKSVGMNDDLGGHFSLAAHTFLTILCACSS